LELELARRDIPFVKYGGLKFLEAAHVKDVLCVLRWVENPRNRMAGFRAARLIPGIGSATVARLFDEISEAQNPVLAIETFPVPLPAATDWNTFLGVFRALRESPLNWPADLEIVTRWYEPHLHRIYEDAFVRQGDLVQLQQIASGYRSREQFLTEITLDPPEATSDQAGVPERDDDYLVLSTIHSAKGQEWKAVHLLNVVDGCLPSDMGTGTPEEIEEERRLLYVAMTRAKEELHMIVPQRFYVHQQIAHGDKHVYASRSRFIPKALETLFESCVWPVAVEGMPASGGDSGSQINIAARVRAFWR
jgi:DNA helicase-2/ATP-dependent DNA helicase PcrA